MARFHDMVGQLKSSLGEDGDPTIFDDLTSEYDNAFEGYSANAAAKDKEIEEREAEITRLKSRNFELLEQVSSQDEPFTKRNPDSEETTGPTIDGLFVRKS